MTAEEEKEYRKRYYREHREKYIAYAKNYYQTHKEQFREYARYRNERNPERKRYYDRLVAQNNIARYGEKQAWIRQARIKQGVSRKELAERLGVTTGAIHNYETGRRRAPEERIKEVFGIE